MDHKIFGGYTDVKMDGKGQSISTIEGTGSGKSRLLKFDDTEKLITFKPKKNGIEGLNSPDYIFNIGGIYVKSDATA